MNFIATLKTDKDTAFTDALITNAVEYEDLPLPSAISGIGGRARNRLSMISIIATQNLSYELFLFSADTHATSDADTNTFVGNWLFDAGSAVRIAGAGLYYYFIYGLDIPYTDDDASGEIHVGLVNRSAGAKTAGAGGAMAVSFTFSEEGA